MSRDRLWRRHGGILGLLSLILTVQLAAPSFAEGFGGQASLVARRSGSEPLAGGFSFATRDP